MTLLPGPLPTPIVTVIHQLGDLSWVQKTSTTFLRGGAVSNKSFFCYNHPESACITCNKASWSLNLQMQLSTP